MNEIINTRSSIRKYKDEPLPEDVVRTLAEAGLKAPTATNKQEIHITVTTKDHPVNKKIQDALDPDARASFYYDAPVIMYLSAEDGFKWSDVDAGIAVENIHLAAASMGLGSVILGCMKKVINGDKKKEYDQMLEIPEGYSFRIGIAVGYPDTAKEQHQINYDRDVTVLY
ncbi:MAG: nitroreductase [Erysipelotrichaceae bacterium]|nr:nitroreductase [Erysipelotrichaceae bacterium]